MIIFIKQFSERAGLFISTKTIFKKKTQTEWLFFKIIVIVFSFLGYSRVFIAFILQKNHHFINKDLAMLRKHSR